MNYYILIKLNRGISLNVAALHENEGSCTLLYYLVEKNFCNRCLD